MLKSAYEIAMERLGKPDTLTEDQKKALGEIDAKFKAQIAEREILVAPQIDAARRSGDSEAAAMLSRMLADERAELEAKCAAEKQKFREKQ